MPITEFVNEAGVPEITLNVPERVRVRCVDWQEEDFHGVSVETSSEACRTWIRQAVGDQITWNRDRMSLLAILRKIQQLFAPDPHPKILRLERKARISTGARQKRLYRRANRLRRKLAQ